MTTKKHPSDQIEVEIFGSTYNLRGGSDPAAVRALAQDLDSRMQALAASAPGADPVKVAILTALRLADEASSAHDDLSDIEGDLVNRLEACSARLARTLEDRPPEIEGGEAAVSLDGASPVG